MVNTSCTSWEEGERERKMCTRVGARASFSLSLSLSLCRRGESKACNAWLFRYDLS